MYGQRQDWDAVEDGGGPTLPPSGGQMRRDRAVRSSTRQNDQPEPVAQEPVPVQQGTTPRAVKTRSISKANPLQKADLKGLRLAEKPTLSHLRLEVLRRNQDERPGNWTAEKCF